MCSESLNNFSWNKIFTIRSIQFFSLKIFLKSGVESKMQQSFKICTAGGLDQYDALVNTAFCLYVTILKLIVF